jgi:hypothetical protein
MFWKPVASFLAEHAACDKAASPGTVNLSHESPASSTPDWRKRRRLDSIGRILPVRFSYVPNPSTVASARNKTTTSFTGAEDWGTCTNACGQVRKVQSCRALQQAKHVILPTLTSPGIALYFFGTRQCTVPSSFLFLK